MFGNMFMDKYIKSAFEWNFMYRNSNAEMDEQIEYTLEDLRKYFTERMNVVKNGLNQDNMKDDLIARGFRHFDAQLFRLADSEKEIAVHFLHTGRARVRCRAFGKNFCSNFKTKKGLLNCVDTIAARLALMG